MNHQSKSWSIRPLAVFFLAGMFYFYEYSLQVSTSVLTEHLIQDFSINAATLAFMVAGFFYAYSPMQVPGGLLFDRFGPRNLLTFMIILCALGSVMFSLTDSVYIATFARFAMGLAAATSFVGILVLCARWFPARHFALLAGIAQLMGCLGAISGKVPFSWLANQTHWRDAYMIMGAIGLILALLVYMVVRDFPVGADQPISHEKTSILGNLTGVLRQSMTWRIALYAFLIWAPVTIFPVQWGVKFLQNGYGISLEKAASMASLIWVGIAIASPLFGFWSDRIQKRKMIMSLCALIGLLSTLPLFLCNQLPEWSLWVICLCFGIAAAGQSLSFAVISDFQKPKYFGTATAFNNMAVVLGGMTMQPLVGILLVYFWDGVVTNGTPVYNHFSFRMVLLIIPICYGLAFLLNAFGIKETGETKAIEES